MALEAVKRGFVETFLEAGAVVTNGTAVLGLTFKQGTDDLRESPSLRVISTLRQMGAIVRAYDPTACDELTPVQREMLRLLIQRIPNVIVNINYDDRNPQIFQTFQSTIEQLKSIADFEILSAGDNFVCALLDTQEAICWGDNNQGQLGYGHTMNIGDDETPASVGPIESSRVPYTSSTGRSPPPQSRATHTWHSDTLPIAPAWTSSTTRR